jgi:hypothetical protein
LEVKSLRYSQDKSEPKARAKLNGLKLIKEVFYDPFGILRETIYGGGVKANTGEFKISTGKQRL